MSGFRIDVLQISPICSFCPRSVTPGGIRHPEGLPHFFISKLGPCFLTIQLGVPWSLHSSRRLNYFSPHFFFFSGSSISIGSVMLSVAGDTLLFFLLVCQAVPGGTQRPHIELRLVGPRSREGEGRLEVLYNGQWGTVCDDDFNMVAASVACRELGYEAAANWAHSAKYGPGEGKQKL